MYVLGLVGAYKFMFNLIVSLYSHLLKVAFVAYLNVFPLAAKSYIAAIISSGYHVQLLLC